LLQNKCLHKNWKDSLKTDQTGCSLACSHSPVTAFNVPSCPSSNVQNYVSQHLILFFPSVLLHHRKKRWKTYPSEEIPLSEQHCNSSSFSKETALNYLLSCGCHQKVCDHAGYTAIPFTAQRSCRKSKVWS